MQDIVLLSGIPRRRRELADLERSHVHNARQDGLSWEDIAAAIGGDLTAERALEQYGEPAEDEEP